MFEGSVCAIFASPFLRCPTIVVKIADTSMICSNPISAWKFDIKYLVHVLVNGNIGVDKDAGLVGDQLESSELGPGVLKSGCDEGRFPVLR